MPVHVFSLFFLGMIEGQVGLEESLLLLFYAAKLPVLLPAEGDTCLLSDAASQRAGWGLHAYSACTSSHWKH